MSKRFWINVIPILLAVAVFQVYMDWDRLDPNLQSYMNIHIQKQSNTHKEKSPTIEFSSPSIQQRAEKLNITQHPISFPPTPSLATLTDKIHADSYAPFTIDAREYQSGNIQTLCI